MPRKQKTDIKVNDTNSLTSLMQETYNDACLLITAAQAEINQLTVGVTPADIDEMTKLAKEKNGFLKTKDSAIKIKLEIAKLQSDIIKRDGDAEAAINERSNGKASLSDFKSIRELIKQNSVENENESDKNDENNDNDMKF
jgi:hypothetical protein